jgi:hypothetical protein
MWRWYILQLRHESTLVSNCGLDQHLAKANKNYDARKVYNRAHYYGHAQIAGVLHKFCGSHE